MKGIDEIYRINLGDTWEKLSDEFGIGIDKLKQINNFTGNSEPKTGSWILIEEIETKLFSEIENLRNTFNLHTYLGYTATPSSTYLLIK